jgi:hypothetical protein
VTLTYGSAQTSFTLLWGSVDNYNDVYFADSAGDVVTGAEIATADPSIMFGHTNVGVTISNLTPFTSITLYTTGYSFEFDTAAIPEPIALALFGTGLIGIGLVRRKRGELTT